MSVNTNTSRTPAAAHPYRHRGLKESRGCSHASGWLSVGGMVIGWSSFRTSWMPIAGD
jgi:hypothetical protein